MRRLPVAAFVALAIATIAAFFVTQHLKVTTPLLTGDPAPHPAAINPVDGQVCKGLSHRSMLVSFYLLNRSDDVDVYIVDGNGNIVATLATGRHMIGGAHPKRAAFTWNGRQADGSVAPDGNYFIRVALVHQGRAVLISNSAGAAEPVTVETVPPRPRVTDVTPVLIPQPGGAKATIRYTGNLGRQGRILIYRTDLAGRPRLVKSFASRRGNTSIWDGTVSGGRPAPQGTYLVGFKVTDRACNTGHFPAELPPLPGSTPHAGVTVRYVAAQPPLTPVPADSSTTVFVDARGHTYHWALRRAGVERVLASGATRRFALSVALPAGAAGLYELAVRWGPHRTVVPLIAGAAAGRPRAPVLVVLPSLTWQGLNPVDDNGDGLPNTLSTGGSIRLLRPLADGLPPGLADEAALLSYLRRAHLAFDLTSDLALAQGAGPAPAGYRGVVLAGDERWLPSSLGAALRSYVAGGGHVLSLGIDSLRRAVTLAGGLAKNGSAPRSSDIFGARPGGLQASRGALILAGRDALGLFNGTSGAFRGFQSYQPFEAVTAAGPVASLAGASSTAPSIIGFRLARGTVIEVGLPGFGSSLARNFDAQQLLGRIWSVLSR